MHSQTLIQNYTTCTTKDDHDQDHNHDHYQDQDHDHDHYQDQDLDLDHGNGENPSQNILNTEPDPPDSFWVSKTKVTEWLDHHTFIERKASVKLVAISRNSDPTQTRSSQRSFSFNYKPKASIIGFGKKPTHNAGGKAKQNDRPENIRLFRNRSEPGRESFLQVNEPGSPMVSCIGRVGSMRVQGRKTGIWKSVKTAFLNRVQMPKKIA